MTLETHFFLCVNDLFLCGADTFAHLTHPQTHLLHRLEQECPQLLPVSLKLRTTKHKMSFPSDPRESSGQIPCQLGLVVHLSVNQSQWPALLCSDWLFWDHMLPQVPPANRMEELQPGLQSRDEQLCLQSRDVWSPGGKLQNLSSVTRYNKKKWLPQEISGRAFFPLVFIHLFSFATLHFLNFYNEHELLAHFFSSY